MNVFGEGIKVLVKHGKLESYLESVKDDGAMICEVEPMVRGYKVSAFRSIGNYEPRRNKEDLRQLHNHV